MAIRIRCECGKTLAIKDELAGKRIRCPACKLSQLVPSPEPAIVPLTAIEPEPEPEPDPQLGEMDSENVRDAHSLDGAHDFVVTPLGRLIPAGIFTANIFATIYLNLMHGKMPARRPNDPSAGKAIGFLFIPFFNLYWFFFTYLRLITRINELREFYQLPPMKLRWLVPVLFILAVIPWVGIANIFFFVPLFLTSIQSGINGLVLASDVPARKRSKVTALIAHYTATCNLRYVWGWYLAIWGVIPGAIAVIAAINVGLEPGVLGFGGAALLLIVGALSCFQRSERMDSARDRLIEDPGSLLEVLQTERRTSIRTRLIWSFLCMLVPVVVTVVTVGSLATVERKTVTVEYQRQDVPDYAKAYMPKEYVEKQKGPFDDLYFQDVMRFIILMLPWVIASVVLFVKAIRFPKIEEATVTAQPKTTGK